MISDDNRDKLVGLFTEGTGLEPHWHGDGWRVGETETHHIDVLPMRASYRVALTPKVPDWSTPARHWVYNPGPAAFLAVAAWEPSPDTEPRGWRQSWDGRTR